MQFLLIFGHLWNTRGSLSATLIMRIVFIVQVLTRGMMQIRRRKQEIQWFDCFVCYSCDGTSFVGIETLTIQNESCPRCILTAAVRDHEKNESELSTTKRNTYLHGALWNSTSFSDEETIFFENDLSDRADERSDSELYSVFEEHNENEMNYEMTTKSTLKRRRCTKQKHTDIVRHSEDCSSSYLKKNEEANMKEHACVNMSYGKRKREKGNINLYGLVSEGRETINKTPSCFSQMEENCSAFLKSQLCHEEREDTESNSTGFLSVKSYNSTADKLSGSALCSLFKESSENEVNNKNPTKSTLKRTKCTHPLYINIVRHSEDSSLSYPKISEETRMEEQPFVHMSRERQIEKGDRTLYERVSKRRGHNIKKSCCYSHRKENSSAIVKPHLCHEDHEDMESNSTGFISVNSYISKDGSITKAELLDTDGQVGSPYIGNQENSQNVYTRNERTNISETQTKNTLEYMTHPITKVNLWLLKQTEISKRYKQEKDKAHMQNDLPEEIGFEHNTNYNSDRMLDFKNNNVFLGEAAFVKDQVTKDCKMPAENALDDNIDTRKSHHLDKLGQCDKFVTNESRKESLARPEHLMDKSHICDFMTMCDENKKKGTTYRRKPMLSLHNQIIPTETCTS